MAAVFEIAIVAAVLKANQEKAVIQPSEFQGCSGSYAEEFIQKDHTTVDKDKHQADPAPAAAAEAALAAARKRKLRAEVHAAMEAVHSAQRQLQVLHDEEKVHRHALDVRRALERECKDLEGKLLALEHDLMQRVATSDEMLAKLKKHAEALRSDLAAEAAAEAESRRSRERRLSEAEELGKQRHELTSKVAASREDLRQIAARFALRPYEREARAAVAAQCAAEAAATAAEKAATAFMAQLQVRSPSLPQAAQLAPTREELQGAVRALEQLVVDGKKAIGGLDAKVTHWRQLWERRQQQCQELQAKVASVEALVTGLQSEVSDVRLRGKAAEDALIRGCLTAAAAERGARAALRMWQAVRLTPLLASTLASLWWLAATPPS